MKTINIAVSGRAWSDAPKSWYILYIKGRAEGSYSTGAWFPKSCCKYEESIEGDGKLTIPIWLFDKLPEKENATLWKEKTDS